MPFSFSIPRLETERLIMRAPCEADVAPETAFYASDRSRFVGGPLSGEQVWRMVASFLGHWAMRGYGWWGIDDKSTGAYLGRVGLWFPQGWPEPEIGWTLMDRAEGNGIAHEAAQAAREYAYQTLGWTTAISLILPGNDRSVRLARKLDAAREGDFTHERFGPVQVWRHPSPSAVAVA